MRKKKAVIRARAATPRATRVRTEDRHDLSRRLRANVRARLEVLGVTMTEVARALGVSRQAIQSRMRAASAGPGALRYLSVLLLCDEDALTAASDDAVRRAWHPDCEAARWLPIVADIIAAGRPLPTYEEARRRVAERTGANGCG